MRRKDEMAMSPTKSSGKAAKKAGKAQKSVLNKTGEKVMGFLIFGKRLVLIVYLYFVRSRLRDPKRGRKVTPFTSIKCSNRYQFFFFFCGMSCRIFFCIFE